MDRRAEIEARLAAATARPWGTGPNRVFAANADGTPATGGMRVGMHPHVATVSREDDAAFIAAAPTDLRWLLDELARVEGECDRLRAIVEGRTTPPTPEEIAAHAGSAQCGVWLWVDRDGWVATGRMFAGLHQFEPQVARFWPLDAEGRPCAWPVTGGAT